MTTQDIEQVIRDLIKSLYCVEYQGVLKVYETTYKFPGREPEHVGYRMDLGLNKDEKPLSIACDGTAKEFIEFIKKELKERSLVRTKYFTAIQLYNNEDGYKQKG